jgi:predicted O-methyltransferase YrrM
MDFDEAARIVEGIPAPHTSARRGRVLYEHIRENRPQNLLELGTARGGSAVFIAAALEAAGTGHLTSVDSTRWQWLDPTPQEVLQRAGLSDRVTLDKGFSTYTWFLKSEIENRLDAAGSVQPEYDFIFLDGSKNWSTDGLAVILAEKLLRPGGWLLLDDLGWNYEKHCEEPRHYEIEIAGLSDEERTQPHLRAVLDLLIRTNPAFDQIMVQDNWWGWAHKSALTSRGTKGGVLSGRHQARGARARMRQMGRPVWRRLPPAAQHRIRGLGHTAARPLRDRGGSLHGRDYNG